MTPTYTLNYFLPYLEKKERQKQPRLCSVLTYIQKFKSEHGFNTKTTREAQIKRIFHLDSLEYNLMRKWRVGQSVTFSEINAEVLFCA